MPGQTGEQKVFAEHETCERIGERMFYKIQELLPLMHHVGDDELAVWPGMWIEFAQVKFRIHLICELLSQESCLSWVTLTWQRFRPTARNLSRR